MDKLALVQWSWIMRWFVCFLGVFVVLALLKRSGVGQEESKHRQDSHGSGLKAAARAYGIKPWLANSIMLSPLVLALVVCWVLMFPPTPYIQSIAVEWIILGE